MRRLVASCSSLTDPASGPAEWVEHIAGNEARRKREVAMLHFPESVCDAGRAEASEVAAHPCPECGAAFATLRALMSHRRVKHGTLAPQRDYTSVDAKCQVCGTQFSTPLRLQAHLSDTRVGRGKCWEKVLADPSRYRRNTAEEQAALDSAACEARRKAQRLGHSQPLSSRAAQTATGRLRGKTAATAH